MENRSQKSEVRSQKSKVGRRKFFASRLSSIILLLLSFILFLFSTNSNAQCAMCRASLESSGQEKQAEALNDGIVYLMVIPYILVAVAGFFIYRMYSKKKN